MPFHQGQQQAGGGRGPLTANNGGADQQQILESILGAALQGRDMQAASAPIAGPKAEVAGIFDFLDGLLGKREQLNEALQTPPGGRRKKKTPRKKSKEGPLKGDIDREIKRVGGDLGDEELRDFIFQNLLAPKQQLAPPPTPASDQQAALQSIFGSFLG
jgi:hypothetical protein